MFRKFLAKHPRKQFCDQDFLPVKLVQSQGYFHLQNDLFWPITLNFGSKLLKIFPPTKSWHKLSLLPSTAVTSLRSRLGSSTNNKQQQEVTIFLEQLTCYKPSLQKLAHHGLPVLSQSPERRKSDISTEKRIFALWETFLSTALRSSCGLKRFVFRN